MGLSLRILALMAIAPAYAADLNDVEWMLGCWQSADGQALEVWVKVSETSFTGFGVAVSGGEFVFYELLRVDSTARGALTYTAYPMGEAPTVFTATELRDERVVFTNPDHDFPQKITYSREGDALSAATSSLDGKGRQSFDKVACD